MGLRWSGNQEPKEADTEVGRALRQLRDALPAERREELLYADVIGGRVMPPREDVVFYVHDPEEPPETPERN